MASSGTTTIAAMRLACWISRMMQNATDAAAKELIDSHWKWRRHVRDREQRLPGGPDRKRRRGEVEHDLTPRHATPPRDEAAARRDAERGRTRSEQDDRRDEEGVVDGDVRRHRDDIEAERARR